MSAISITASAVLRGNGTIQLGTAGATITQGQALYQDTATAGNPMKLADADAGSVGDLIRQGIYFALSAASSGQPIAYTGADSALQTGATTPLTSGATIYLGATAGAITATYADLGTGATVVQLGVVNTDLTLNFAPLIGGTK